MASVKLEDFEILQGGPIQIKVGKKFALLKQLSVGVYFTKFVPEFTALLSVFGKELDGIDFPVDDEWKDRSRLERFRASLTASFNSDRLRRGFLRMLKRVGILRMSVRYFEKHGTVADLVRLFVGTYKINVDSVKKNVRRALQETIDRLSRTSTGSSTGEGGLAPGQHEFLPPRFRPLKTSASPSPESCSSSDGSEKPSSPPSEEIASDNGRNQPEPEAVKG